MKLFALLGFVGALASGCASQQASRAPQTATDVELVAIGAAFDVKEIPERSKRASEPEAGLVDYKSSILVRPDKLALARLIETGQSSSSGLPRERVEALEREIERSGQLVHRLEALSGAVTAIAKYEQDAVALYTDVAERGVAASDPRYAALALQREPVIDALNELARLHTEAVEVGAVIDWKAQPEEGTPADEQLAKIKSKRDRVYERMAPSPEGGRVRFDAGEFTRVLNETSGALNRQLEQLQSAVEQKAPEGKLDMEAALLRGDQRQPISIAPYMIVAGETRGAKSRRVAMPGKEDADRVRKGFEAQAELAKAINGLAKTLGDEQARQALLDGAVTQLKNAADHLRDQVLVDLKDLAEGNHEVVEVKQAAKELRDELAQIERDVRSVVETADPVVRLERALALVQSFAGGKLSDLSKKFKVLASALEKAAFSVETDLGKLAARMQATLASEAEGLLGALDGAPGGADVSALFRSLGKMYELSRAREFAKLEPGSVIRKSFGLDAAVDGFIDLANTEADDQDELSLTYRITVHPDSTEERREYVGSTALGVRKFGLYTTLKSQLLFYDQAGKGGSTYRAAPGVAYNFHYRPRQCHSFFDVVAPGVGVSVLSPSVEGAAELAIGLQATFFNDMFQAGFAYNISVDDDQGLFYFGLDLIGALQGVQ